jgi:hypothetical protein
MTPGRIDHDHRAIRQRLDRQEDVQLTTLFRANRRRVDRSPRRGTC